MTRAWRFTYRREPDRLVHPERITLPIRKNALHSLGSFENDALHWREIDRTRQQSQRSVRIT
jgi:hypothetical protein